MIVDLIDKLIDRLIQLYKHREVRRDILANYIEPIYSEFEAVHNDYLESFRRYRNLIKSSDESLESILDIIREDHLFSEGLRSKLILLSNDGDRVTWEQPEKTRQDPIIGNFARSIYNYLTQFKYKDSEYFSKWDNLLQFPADFPAGLPLLFRPQRFRNTLMEELTQLIKDADQKEVERIWRQQALRAIDWLIQDIQDSYKAVNYYYLELKRNLLT